MRNETRSVAFNKEFQCGICFRAVLLGHEPLKPVLPHDVFFRQTEDIAAFPVNHSYVAFQIRCDKHDGSQVQIHLRPVAFLFDRFFRQKTLRDDTRNSAHASFVVCQRDGKDDGFIRFAANGLLNGHRNAAGDHLLIAFFPKRGAVSTEHFACALADGKRFRRNAVVFHHLLVQGNISELVVLDEYEITAGTD
ncbi:hypothetical protein SDC9_57635 [bioreactor metagenome]|uniref:Uncharacterized protein n=1 Tax=bioreactor metagenome TaxID=1076179 RepID=A0A644XAU4_9ZZZZ